MKNRWKHMLLFLLAALATSFVLSLACAEPSPSPLPMPSPAASSLPTPLYTAVPDVAAPPEWLSAVLVQMQSLPYVGPVITFVMKWAAVLAVVLTSLALFFMGLAKGLDTVSELSPYLQWMSKIADGINRITPWLKWASMLNHPKPWSPDAAGPEKT